MNTTSMNILVISFSEFYHNSPNRQNNCNLVKLKELVEFRQFKKIVVVMDKPLGILPKTVLEIFYKNLDCPRDVMRIVKSVNDVMGEIFPINVDNLYLFMPISAKSKIDPLHCVFEKMQPDKNVCLCLIGVPNVIDYEFDSYVEFPPVANNWSVFEGL